METMTEKLMPCEADIGAGYDNVAYKAVHPYNEERTDPNNTKSESSDESKIKPLPYYSLFRYSTTCEKLLILMSVLFSIVSGFANPLLAVFLGNVTNLMVNYNLSREQLATNRSIIANISGAEFVTDDEFKEGVIKFCWYMAAIGAMLLITIAVTIWVMNYTAERQTRRIRNMYMKAMLRQEISWFDTHQSGEFSSKVGENLQKLQMGMGEKIALTMYFFSSFIISIIIAFIVGWKLTLVMLSVSPLLSISTGVLSKVQAEFASKELVIYGKAAAIAEEVLGAIRTVVAFGGEKKEIKRYSEKLLDAKKSGIKRGIISAVGLSMFNLFIFVVYALSFWYGVKLVIESRVSGSNEYTAGSMLNVFMNVMFGSMFIGQIAPFMEVFSTAKAAAASVFQIIENEPLIDSFSSEGKTLSALKGNIKFDNVSFQYPSRPSVPVLQGLSFEVESGKTIALVGSSGCGKSTVTQLIQRFYDPCSGSVIVDDVNIKDFNVGWLRENIGVVGQEPALFATTIKENIRYGREDVTDDEIKQATKASNAHDFIMKLPDKYDTLVGAKGTQMSGGQKQRIAIARALVRNPKILLLDEATSALDSESESIVQAALDKASEGRTTIIIAHRLSTVRNADKILVISNGVIQEQGTHDQLMENRGAYYQLVSLQIDDTGDSDDKENLENSIPDLIRTLSRKLSALSGNSSHLSLNDESNTDDDEDIAVPNVIWNTFKLNFPELHFIIIGVIMAVLVGVSYTVYSFYFGQVLNVFSVTNNKEASSKSISYSVIFLAIGGATGLCCFVQVSMFAISGEKLTTRIRKLAFTAMLRQEIGWHDDKRNSTGILCARLSSDASGVHGATGVRLATVIQSIATIGSAIALSFYLNWQLALVVGAFIPLIFITFYYDGKFGYSQMLAEKSSVEEGNRIAVEALDNIRTVASLHRERMFYEMYVSCFKSSFRLVLRNTVFRAVIMALSQSIVLFAYAASFYYGGHLIINKVIPYKDLYIVLEAVLVATFTSAQALAFTPDYQKAKISAAKIFQLLWRQPVIDSYMSGGITPTSCQGKLSFENVSFSYPTRPDAQVLKDVSFLLKPGRTVALVGSSGCGKSTCIQLIERFYDPDTGYLVVDGANTSDSLNVSWMRSKVGLVQQEPILFGYSVRDNIAYGDNTRDDVPMTEIIDAARSANIHDFITSLPHRYETNVGSRGMQMSGGQKQRIAIARALIRKPKLLLLDEATSALDSESEKVVEEALVKAREGRSCITIAHRLSTIQNADLIIAMKHGSIVEMGTHQELLKLQGIYYSFYRKQQGSIM